jgi:hypothetical protein
MVGHRPIDPATGAATAAAGQTQVSVDSAVAALDPRRWEWIVAPAACRRHGGRRRDTGATAVVMRWWGALFSPVHHLSADADQRAPPTPRTACQRPRNPDHTEGFRRG